jgi:hypothetical protein
VVSPCVDLASCRGWVQILTVETVSIFFSALGGKHSFMFWFFFVTGIGLSSVFISLQTYWMGYWAEQYRWKNPTDVNVAL